MLVLDPSGLPERILLSAYLLAVSFLSSLLELLHASIPPINSKLAGYVLAVLGIGQSTIHQSVDIYHLPFPDTIGDHSP